ncbi:protein FADD [Anoplopoma fimbria]|uniref:protein FADD n=1 Tax=Anoplopoma fimbria TaxID=229290 RepID=UPI0023EC71B9|nr:protein FADD [Anoplopoma fimbria]
MSAPQFNSVLLDISNQLSVKQLEDMKFLCNEFIGKRAMEKISSGTQLFLALREMGKLGADKTEYLSQLLNKINRCDLANKLDNFESPSGSGDNQPDEAERAKLDAATDVIADNLGKNWRKLGRKLLLSEVRLESVSTRHTDLEETARELLKEWRKSRGAEARASMLVDALRVCQLNLTADKVEDKIQTL